MAFIILVVALVVATLGAVGVAAIGLLLNRWFELTQWQGSLIALAIALSVGFVAFRLTSTPESPGDPDWVEWDDLEDEAPPAEPPIVPWRRQRPTQGDLPDDKSRQKGSRSK